MAIRLRCPSGNLTSGVRATVVESDVPLLAPGDFADFTLDEGRTTRGTLRVEGNDYPLDNIHFLSDMGDDPFTLIQAELAD